MSEIVSKKIDDYFSERFAEKSSFTEYIASISPLINEACGMSCECLLKKRTGYFFENLYSPYTTFVENAGKRSRPAIALLGSAMFGEKPSLALSPALAIEHFHSAALIHDDIADDAKTRRGEVCLHLKTGVGLAINCGDFGLNYMNTLILQDARLSQEVKIRLLSEINKMANRTIEGQALDIGWAHLQNYDLMQDDYFAMAESKTAHYSVATPLVCGAICSEAADEDIESLRSFGLKVGLAFQIQDDILNLRGLTNDTGKGECDDLTEGKRTLIVIHALNNASQVDRARLIEVLASRNTTQEDLNDALSIIESSSSIDYAMSYANELIEKAVAQLCENIESSHVRDMTVSLAKWSLIRKK